MVIALADNTRTATKATIKRASARARRGMNKFDADVADALKQAYSTALNDIQQSISVASRGEETLRLEVLSDLRSQLETRLTFLESEKQGLLDDSMLEAAKRGVEIFNSEASKLGSSLNSISEDALKFVKNYIAEDGLQLSDRIWRNNIQTHDAVVLTVEQAIIQGHSAQRAAEEFIAAGTANPAETLRKIKRASPDEINRLIKSEWFAGDGGLDNALRLFRTEINRAHGESYMAAAFEHPEVVGMRFLLSPNHPRTDICDMHARVNRYGLGPGVYPKGRNPWPAHPNTLSYVEVVFDDEVSDEDKKNKTDRIDFLKQQSNSFQTAALGSRRKAAALQRDVLRENEINTPWYVLKEKYQKRGHRPDVWPPLGLPNPSRSPSLPVSNALELNAHKRTLAPTLGAIDAVHDDGELPNIPVVGSHSTKTLGFYAFTHGGKSLRIGVSSKGGDKGFTLAHEIGHFIDHQAIGVPGEFASEKSELMKNWRDAVSSTQAYRQIKTLRDGPNVVVARNGRSHSVSKKYLDYLGGFDEVWARSYAQYIALKSENKALLDALRNIQTQETGAPVWYASQWDDEDFAPVSSAIDLLFKDLGYLK